MYMSRSNSSAGALELRNPNLAKEAIISKQIEMKSQNQTAGTTTKCDTFRGLSNIFSALEFSQMQQISVKHCLINFMLDKSDNKQLSYYRHV